MASTMQRPYAELRREARKPGPDRGRGSRPFLIWRDSTERRRLATLRLPGKCGAIWRGNCERLDEIPRKGATEKPRY